MTGKIGKIEVYHDGQSWVVRHERPVGKSGEPYYWPVHRTHHPKEVPWLVQAIMVGEGVIE